MSNEPKTDPALEAVKAIAATAPEAAAVKFIDGVAVIFDRDDNPIGYMPEAMYRRLQASIPDP